MKVTWKKIQVLPIVDFWSNSRPKSEHTYPKPIFSNLQLHHVFMLSSSCCTISWNPCPYYVQPPNLHHHVHAMLPTYYVTSTCTGPAAQPATSRYNNINISFGIQINAHDITHFHQVQHTKSVQLISNTYTKWDNMTSCQSHANAHIHNAT